MNDYSTCAACFNTCNDCVLKPNNMETQNKLILNRLKQGKPVSPMYALNQFECMRLAARIGELRKAGHAIKTEMVKHNKKRFALYTLES